ncbi:MAG: toll/interleukin-1 receptor domain-containing protein [Clostridia bacterium]
MAILKCKMCGGNIEITENQKVGVCDSCGSTMTLPNVNDERILNLFDRANHFRLQNEFDKALSAYESILTEDNRNAEAYWGCVLSRYGIEYVEDPKTHKRVPTCHRVQNESILSDLDYKAAVEYSDDYQAQSLYKQEAEAISAIQKNILSIASKEAPYDIFICYKETDNSGKRTIDSTLAQDIYYQLTNEGYKVFFSRITLEDKLGTEYEPYIFSALNSAKVMLVVGTSKEYFNAIWVKNEWARFLDLAKRDKSKMIIPCYRDMDAYDLPDEISMFQSQDMSKIGFVQDLIRGIKKVLQKETAQPNVNVVNKTEVFQSEPLLKRAFILIEAAEWQKADELLEQVLNHEPENARAYLGKLMIEIKVNKEENLANRAVDYSKSMSYQNALRFADDNFKPVLINYCETAQAKYKKIAEEKLAKEQEEKAKKEQSELALHQKFTKLENDYFALKDMAKKAMLKKFVITEAICIPVLFVSWNIIANRRNGTPQFVLLLFFLAIVAEFLMPVILLYSEYNTIIAKQKAKMILAEEESGNRELDKNTKLILNAITKDTTLNLTNMALTELDVKKVCKSIDLSLNMQSLSYISDLINRYKPKK